MGAKGSKPPTKNNTKSAPEPPPTPRVVHISANQIIDPSDASIFPEKVRNELMAVRAEIPPHELFLVKEFDGSSEFVKWLHGSKSFFNYEPNTENENETNNTDTNTNDMAYREEERRRLQALRNALRASVPPSPPVNTTINYGSNALVNRLARLTATKGGNGVERNKDPFMYELSNMCDSPDIREEFLANQLEVANHYLLAFLNTGHIAGFSILGETRHNGRTCIHQYLICTGPRRLGIGAGLVKKLHEIAKEQGFTCATLGASESEEFHTKQGYKRTGRNTLEGPEMLYEIKGGGNKKRKTRKQRRK